MKINKNDLNKKLDEIIKNEKKILENEKKILGEELNLENLEKKELKKELKTQKTEKELLKEVETLEKEFNNNFNKTIKKITKRDIVKGFVGAFVGVMSHFAFAKATSIALKLNLFRAISLYIVAFLIISLMLYYSGFKNIKKHLVLKFMPLRAIILYLISIITIIFVNLLFGEIHFNSSLKEYFYIISANIILAVMGAGTADLIGRNN